MTEHDRRDGRIATFEVTVKLPAEHSGIPSDIDLDVLIAPPEIAEQGLVLAIASLEEVELLVSAGAEVTVRAKVPDRFPKDQIATDEEVLARVEEATKLGEMGDN
jgi:hypothetical protein